MSNQSHGADHPWRNGTQAMKIIQPIECCIFDDDPAIPQPEEEDTNWAEQIILQSMSREIG